MNPMNNSGPRPNFGQFNPFGQPPGIVNQFNLNSPNNHPFDSFRGDRNDRDGERIDIPPLQNVNPFERDRRPLIWNSGRDQDNRDKDWDRDRSSRDRDRDRDRDWDRERDRDRDRDMDRRSDVDSRDNWDEDEDSQENGYRDYPQKDRRDYHRSNWRNRRGWRGNRQQRGVSH